MTIQEAKEKLIEWANHQIGTHEGPNNQNPYAPTASKLYGLNVQNQPWCDVFVDAGFIKLFGYDLGSAMTYQYTGCGGAACAQSASYYKAHNAWYGEPQVGDQIFFISGGGINHTGIVTNVGMGAITTVEGNSSDMVARRSYAIGSPQIAGYGRPNWGLVEGKEFPEPSEEPPVELVQEPQTVAVTVNLPVLRKGDTGYYVKMAQTVLELNGFTCGWYGVDGEYGPATEQAVKNLQIARCLDADGVTGKVTWVNLLNE